jgi:hypothetical protein
MLSHFQCRVKSRRRMISFHILMLNLVLAEEGAILPGSLHVHAEQIAVHHLTLLAVLKASGAGVGDHGSKEEVEHQDVEGDHPPSGLHPALEV